MNKQLCDALNAIDRIATDPLIAAKCRGLIRGYDARWSGSDYVAISVERSYLGEAYNPQSSGKSRTFFIAGKLDAVARYGARTVVVDHKTCSQDITDPNGPYWRQLIVEGQINHYMLLLWQNGIKCDEALWDVVRKPGIAPKKLSKAELKQATSFGEYFGDKINASDMAELIREERETASMFEARLAHDCTVERPEWYFQRKSYPRFDAEIIDYQREVWQHSQDILSSRSSTSEKNLPVRNSGACMLYGSPCNFLGICSGYDLPDSDKWRRKELKHAELPADIQTKELLTNSRIRCFQTCRRKHYYEYELGIERNNDSDTEAQYFGTLFHAGLEAWWNCLLENSNEHSGEESPASGVGNSTSEAQLAV